MPIEDEEFRTRTREEVRQPAISTFEQLFDNPATNNGDITYELLRTLAAVAVENQEQDLQEVYNAGYIQRAEDAALTNKAAEIGVERRAATSATGWIALTRETPATQDYVVRSGTSIQTPGDDSVEFETTETIVVEGPQDLSDTNSHTTSSTSPTTQTTHTVDVHYRDSVSVSVDISTNDSNYAASVEIVDTTTDTTVLSETTTNTSSTTFTTTYDVSSIEDTIDLEYQLSIADSSALASLVNATATVDGQTGSNADIIAADAGAETNVAADTIVAGSSTISGVDDVTNPNPTGDPDFTDTDGDALVQGTDQEDDESLRERALETTSIGGAATLPSIEAALLNIDDVIDATISVDQGDDTIEPIIYGGEPSNIGPALFDVFAVTEETIGGVNGTEQSYTVSSDILSNGERTIYWSDATVLDVDLTIDLVHDDSFVGEAELRNQIVEYIGGTSTDGSQLNGEVGVGEDIYLTDLENRIEGDDNGVVGVTDITTTPASSTNANGLDVIPVGDGEYAEADGTDNSITVNPTPQ